MLFLFLLMYVSCKPPIEKEQAQMNKQRVLAIGDLHADLAATKDVFQLAKIIDGEGNWIATNTTVVQTGDLTDRGPNGKTLLQFIQKLEREAPQHNSQLISLIGNHESMNILGDWRYVSPKDVEEFGGKEARIQAFSPHGEWFEWILTHNAVAKVDNTVFVHGGISTTYSKMGIEGLNEAIKKSLSTRSRDSILGSDGPLWYRGFAQDPEEIACPALNTALHNLNAKRMVVGHTTQRDGSISSRCEGKLLIIDTGISHHYGSHLAILDLTNDDAKAIYLEKGLDLPDPN